jgi:hypothetical protein
VRREAGSVDERGGVLGSAEGDEEEVDEEGGEEGGEEEVMAWR